MNQRNLLIIKRKLFNHGNKKPGKKPGFLLEFTPLRINYTACGNNPL